MPANLTPQYLEAERRFREAKSTEEKLAALDEMLAVIPKHKGTEHLRGDLKRRYAKLKADAEVGPAASGRVLGRRWTARGRARWSWSGPPTRGSPPWWRSSPSARPRSASIPSPPGSRSPG